MLYPDSQSVREAQMRYYELNNLPKDGGVCDGWARYKMGSVSFTAFPNFDHRRLAIRRHDVHHVVHNLDTSSLGEGLIAAWELGSGCGKYWISWCLEPQALWWGILFAPKKTFDFFVQGRRSRNFFHEDFTDDLWRKTVGELRAQLLPAGPEKARVGDVLAFAGCALLGVAMVLIFIPIFLFFTIWGLVFRH